MKTYKLFVYGTLRHGCHNHGLMGMARFLGSGTTQEPMALKVQWGIPFTDRCATGQPLVGELYEIDEVAIRPIHQMELSAGYTVSWHTVLVDGQSHRALVYTYLLGDLPGAEDVPSCDYRRWMMGQ